jgi:hypothetical protein
VSASIPIADGVVLRRPWQRTSAVRAVLAIALVGLVLLTAALASRPATHPLTFLPRSSNGIVLLDLSASISSDTFDRIGQTLDELAATKGRYGLVVFSDVAYQALPPGTPSSALLSYARYFKVPAQTAPGLAPAFPTNPWTTSFSAGTRISAGLGLALQVIDRQHLARPGVILVSDLDDDPGDAGNVASTIAALRHVGVQLHIVALNPAPKDEQLYQQLLGAATDITPARLPSEARTTNDAPFPMTLALLAAAVAVVLGLNEVYGARLTWGTAA